MSELSVSAYTMETPLPDGQTVLFNALTHSLCLMDQAAWKRMRKCDGYPSSGAHELMSRGFLVENDLDEALVLTHWRLVLVHDLSHLSYFIQMGPVPAHRYPDSELSNMPSRVMTRQTARQVIDFMIKDIETKRPLSVDVTFGLPSEPSFRDAAAAPLNLLTEALYLFCRGKQIDFRSHLLVRGTELKSDQVLNLKGQGLSGIRIPITYFGGKDDDAITRQLMSQIMALGGMVGLDLEIGYDPRIDWRNKICRLLDRFSDQCLQPVLTGLRIHPVHDASVPFFHPFPDCTCQGHTANERFLKQELVRRGFSCPEEPPHRRCPARYRSTVMIEPDGRISPCPCLSHFPELDLGHILHGIDIRQEALTRFQSIPDRCRACAVLPLCDGGGLCIRPGISPSSPCPNGDLVSVVQAYMIRQSHLF